jgi:hypothetical protein
MNSFLSGLPRRLQTQAPRNDDQLSSLGSLDRFVDRSQIAALAAFHLRRRRWGGIAGEITVTAFRTFAAGRECKRHDEILLTIFL